MRKLLFYSLIILIVGCSSDDARQDLCMLTTPHATANSRVIVGSTLRLSTTNTTMYPGGFYWTGPNGFTSTERSPILYNMSSEMVGTYFVKKIMDNCESATDSVDVSLLSYVNPELPECVPPNNTSQGYDVSSSWSEDYQSLGVNHPTHGNFLIRYNGWNKLMPGIYQCPEDISIYWNYGSVMNVVGPGTIYVQFTPQGKVKIAFCELPLSYYSVSGGFSGSQPPIDGNFTSTNTL